MRALVVYESMFGNTRKIAETVAVGIGEHMSVHLVEVSEAPTTLDADIELLVVGGPTHERGMTTAETRAEAASRSVDHPLVSRGIGLREWLQAVRPAGPATFAAAFDTRISAPMVFTGSAARGYAVLLGEAGFQLVDHTESFHVGRNAPQEDALDPGEVDRAGKWGRKLAALIPPSLPEVADAAVAPRDAHPIEPPTELDPTATDRPTGELRREPDVLRALPDSAELEHGMGRRRI
jgi:hypothetical protein